MKTFHPIEPCGGNTHQLLKIPSKLNLYPRWHWKTRRSKLGYCCGGVAGDPIYVNRIMGNLIISAMCGHVLPHNSIAHIFGIICSPLIPISTYKSSYPSIHQPTSALIDQKATIPHINICTVWGASRTTTEDYWRETVCNLKLTQTGPHPCKKCDHVYSTEKQPTTIHNVRQITSQLIIKVH